MAELAAADLPTAPGVYGLYRGVDRVYVGKAASLRDRVWKNHSGRGASMGSSALRRNVAEHLGIASAADIKTRRYRPTEEDARRVREWLKGCDVAWIECADHQAAKDLERDMKAAHKPPLTRQ
jgi:hypothetical protein